MVMNLWHILYKPPEQSPTGQSTALHTAPRKLGQAPSPLRMFHWHHTVFRMTSEPGCLCFSHICLLWQAARLFPTSGPLHMLWKWKCQPLSCVWLVVTPWTAAHQAPLSMGFSRQEYWSWLPLPPPEDLPNSGNEPRSRPLQAHFLPLSHQGSPYTCYYFCQSYGFPRSHVWMWELDHKEGGLVKNWCFRIVVLEKTLESLLDSKEIKLVNTKDINSEYYWSWSSDTLATWFKELIHWKRHWCWERLKAKGEGGSRGWDG